MNLVEKRLRDKFLTRVTGKTDLINFPEMEGFLCLFGWSKKQPWWDKFISDFLLKNHWDKETFVNTVYRFLEKRT